MGRLRLKLVSGREYLFTHRRLKTIKARFVRIVRAPGSDPDDEYYIECDVAGLDCSVRPPSLRETGTLLLRPSMVTLIQDVPQNYAPPVAEFASPLRTRRGIPKPGIVNRMQVFIRTFMKS